MGKACRYASARSSEFEIYAELFLPVLGSSVAGGGSKPAIISPCLSTPRPDSPFSQEIFQESRDLFVAPDVFVLAARQDLFSLSRRESVIIPFSHLTVPPVGGGGVQALLSPLVTSSRLPVPF